MLTNKSPQLDKSVGVARSDDTKHMHDIIPTWLAGYQEARHLGNKAKSGHGFMNEVTGAFLCPVHIKWLQNEEYVPFLDLAHCCL